MWVEDEVDRHEVDVVHRRLMKSVTLVESML